jgi:anaphase-promoting complex subunit 2
VLSKSYWPELREDMFNLPKPVYDLQNLYEKGFEAQHNLMRLKWLPALGRATVELQFEDRVVKESVPPWVASVIYAFDESSDAPTKTVEGLKNELNMEESLVRNAVSFWIGKRVLLESAPDSGLFSVLETLPDQGSGNVPGPMVQEEVSAVKSTQDLFKQHEDVYRSFILMMLTNQGNRPVQVILQMAKALLAEGFPFGEAEMKSLLQTMEEEGLLTGSGGLWSVRKI